jgi:hypothetical protein
MEIYLNVEESEASVLTSEMRLIHSGFEIGQDRCNMVIIWWERTGRYG